MQLYHLYTSMMHTNTYVVVSGNEAFVVDAGADAIKIKAILDKLGVRLDAILLTHGHFDHIGGVAELLRLCEGDDPKVMIHSADAEFIASRKNLASEVGTTVEPFTPDIILKGGEEIIVAGLPVKVINTPGHSDGGVCYIVENKIFSGDTLFFCTYGRTDLYDGSFRKLKNSIINKLFRLKGNYTVLPGHGEPTTLDFERVNNPILTDSEDITD